MLSLTDSIRISSPLSDSRLSFLSQTGSRTSRQLKFGRCRRARVSRCKCSATEQPPPQRRKQRPEKYKQSEEDKGIDPVGFLSKYGITHKAFAQFLRERWFCNALNCVMYCVCYAICSANRRKRERNENSMRIFIIQNISYYNLSYLYSEVICTEADERN